MPGFSSPLAEVGVVIPVRSFAGGKSRLAGAFGEGAAGAAEHAAFVRSLADRAADAAVPHPTVVVTSAPEVVAWAAERNLAVIDDRGSLDIAAADGRAWAAEQGLARIVIVHADLPDITSLDAVTGDGGARVAAIVPCHRDDGTPVLSVPVAAPFAFSYGPGSFARHVDAARAAGLDVRVVRNPRLAFDIDGLDDLALVRARRPLCPER